MFAGKMGDIETDTALARAVESFKVSVEKHDWNSAFDQLSEEKHYDTARNFTETQLIVEAMGIDYNLSDDWRPGMTKEEEKALPVLDVKTIKTLQIFYSEWNEEFQMVIVYGRMKFSDGRSENAKIYFDKEKGKYKVQSFVG